MEKSERSAVHVLFGIGVLIKGLHGLADLVGAFIIYVISGTTIYNIATSIVSKELIEDPNDFLANLLLQHAHVSTNGKEFIALYLFVAAIANLVIAVGLLMHRRYMFPIANIILGTFVIYQVYIYFETRSPWVLFLALYDCAIVGLIFAEHKRRWPRVEFESHAL